MTNVDFIKFVSDKSGLTQKEIRSVLGAVEDGLREFLYNGNGVKVLDTVYGVKTVAEHVGRNPSTGESITIPEHKAVTVKASKTLKDYIK